MPCSYVSLQKNVVGGHRGFQKKTIMSYKNKYRNSEKFMVYMAPFVKKYTMN